MMEHLRPLSLVSQDLEGNSYQLWKRKATFILSILNNQGKMTIISGDKVHNALQPQETGKELLSRLERLGRRKWHVAHIAGHAYVWPYLVAAGQDGTIDPSQTLSGKGEIPISEKATYQLGPHFNKHGRLMGFKSKKEYNVAAKDFAKIHQSNPL